MGNPGFDGPDVISSYDAHEKFYRIFMLKLYEADPTMPFPIQHHPPDYIRGCQRSIYYFTDDVARCETILMSIQPKSADDVFTQYFSDLYFLCNLKPVNLFNSRKPFQGELRLCSVFGFKEHEITGSVR